MAKDRRNSTGAEKMAILREHLIDQVPISEVDDQHGRQHTIFCRWQKKLSQDGTAVFDAPRRQPKRHQDARAHRIEALEAKVRRKDGTGEPDALPVRVPSLAVHPWLANRHQPDAGLNLPLGLVAVVDHQAMAFVKRQLFFPSDDN